MIVCGRRKIMKIALINENSQAGKNKLICDILKRVADKYGDEVLNFGMYGDSDNHSLTYVKAGLLAGILLNSGVVDFVITGCGTGQGAMLALNSFPNVICGHITDPSDAFMFREINNGNSASFPFAKGFGWGSELDLENMFDKLLSTKGGNGYPKERAVPERQNKLILDKIKNVTYRKMIDILKEIDQEFLKETIDYPYFKDVFFKNCKDKEIGDYLSKLLDKA